MPKFRIMLGKSIGIEERVSNWTRLLVLVITSDAFSVVIIYIYRTIKRQKQNFIRWVND